MNTPKSDAAITEYGYLHQRNDTFGKLPYPLMHDLDITDGATRLYSHMHWRYGSNRRNFEGQQSMAEAFDVVRNTIVARIKELESKDWVVVIERDFNKKSGKYQTAIYHVFEDQEDCREFRQTYQPKEGEVVREKSEARKRKSRKGVGGNPKLKGENRANSSSHVHGNSSSHVRANSSSHYLDSLYLDSVYPDTEKKNTFPAGAGVSVFLELLKAYVAHQAVTSFVAIMEAYVRFEKSKQRGKHKGKSKTSAFDAFVEKELDVKPLKPLKPPITEAQAAVIYVLGLKRPEHDDKGWGFLNQWVNFFQGTIKSKTPKNKAYYDHQLDDFKFTPVQIVAYKKWYESEHPTWDFTTTPEGIGKYAGAFWLSPKRARAEEVAAQELAEFIERDKRASMPPPPQPEEQEAAPAPVVEQVTNADDEEVDYDAIWAEIDNIKKSFVATS